MRVVSNTSPVSNLAVIGRLGVLRVQFGGILIPEAVRFELARLEHAGGRRAIERACADGWIRVEKLANRDLADALSLLLDAGESEAIAMALERRSEVLVMDESAGRAMARTLGVTITGTLGVLLKELRAGKLISMAEEMDRLVNEAGFFLSPKVRRTFLEAAGEA